MTARGERRLVIRPAAPWVEDALCKQKVAEGELTVDDFFPSPGNFDHSNLRAVCAACPVQQQCLEAGLSEHHGMWGGYSERERRRIRRAQRRAS